MKGVKLKPLFLKSDDILVGPPEQLSALKARHQDAFVASTEQLPSLVRGRKLKKQSQQNKSSDEIEQVKRLTEFRANYDSPSRGHKSPIRRYTFKRLGTIRLSEQPILLKDFSAIVQDSIINAKREEQVQDFYGVVKTILTKEKAIRHQLTQQTNQISVTNRRFEDHQREKYEFLKRELNGYSTAANKLTNDIEVIRTQLSQYEAEYKSELHILTDLETRQVRLLSEYKQKKNPNIGEIDKVFIERERIRAQKQEAYIEHSTKTEGLEKDLHTKERMLDGVVEQRRLCKKDLRSIKSTLINFYYNCLKQGLDVRDDGLRWGIKALWAIEEAVPLSIFPKFLDEMSACYLLTVARKELEAKHLKAKIQSLKNQLRTHRIHPTTQRSTHEMLTNIKRRLKSISRSVVESPLKGRLGDIPPYKATMKIPQDFSGLEMHQELDKMQEKVRALNKHLDVLAIEEVKRVAQEYKGDDEKLGTVGLEHILNSLLGNKANDYRKFLG